MEARLCCHGDISHHISQAGCQTLSLPNPQSCPAHVAVHCGMSDLISLLRMMCVCVYTCITNVVGTCISRVQCGNLTSFFHKSLTSRMKTGSRSGEGSFQEIKTRPKSSEVMKTCVPMIRLFNVGSHSSTLQVSTDRPPVAMTHLTATMRKQREECSHYYRETELFSLCEHDECAFSQGRINPPPPCPRSSKSFCVTPSVSLGICG